MTKLVQRQLMLAKVEATYNTDAAPTAATNSILVQNVSLSEAGLRMEKRQAIRGDSIAPLQDIYGGSLYGLSFECEVKGSGTAGTVPEIDPLLLACGMQSAVVASTSVTYTPNSATSMASVTLYLYQDGSLVKLTGARGTVSFDIKAGGIVTAKFKFTGHFVSYTDVALPTPTFNATVPVAALNLTTAFGSYDPVCESITFDLGNKVEMVPALNTPDGYAQVMISARDVKGSFDPQADTAALMNYFTEISAGTTAAFNSGAIGTVGGNIININCPKIYISKIGESKARSGILCYAIDFGAVENAGVDNEISIAFT